MKEKILLSSWVFSVSLCLRDEKSALPKPQTFVTLLDSYQ